MKKYSQEQINAADNTNLVMYLEANGHTLKREGSQFRHDEHDSLYIKDNQWYWFSRKKGGKAISFLMEYEGKTFTEAMHALTGEQPVQGEHQKNPPQIEHSETRNLLLPEAAPDNRAAFAYLKSRGISPKLINECIKNGTIYQTNMFFSRNEDGTYEKHKSSPQVVFVGMDKTGTPRYACTRSCTGNSKHDAYESDKAYAFSIPDGNSKAVWVFESAIDLLSHATLCGYSKNSYPAHRISLGGISPVSLQRYLNDYPQVCYVNLALDADSQGREASESIKSFLGDRYTVYDHPPVYGKDYNEDLLIRQEMFQEKRRSGPQEER